MDASVAVKWVVEEVRSERAAALAGQPLAAPALWIVECANVLWAKARRGELDASEARSALHELTRAPLLLIPSEEVADTAMELALELDVTVYDALYLAVALRLSAVLVTDDRRLAAAAHRHPRLSRLVVRLDAFEP